MRWRCCRVVIGDISGRVRVRVRDPAWPDAGPVEVGRHDRVNVVAVLPDGRVVAGGSDRRVQVWDPATPGAGPVEVGRHDGWVMTLAVLPDGRVVAAPTGRCACGTLQAPLRSPGLRAPSSRSLLHPVLPQITVC
jgi:WD40 repeat protein